MGEVLGAEGLPGSHRIRRNKVPWTNCTRRQRPRGWTIRKGNRTTASRAEDLRNCPVSRQSPSANTVGSGVVTAPAFKKDQETYMMNEFEQLHTGSDVAQVKKVCASRRGTLAEVENGLRGQTLTDCKKMSEEENLENSKNDMTDADYSDNEDWNRALLEQYSRIHKQLPKLKPPVSRLTDLLRIVESWIQDFPQYHEEADELETIMKKWKLNKLPNDEALQQFVEKYQIPEVVAIQEGGREKETIGLDGLGAEDDMHSIEEEWIVDLKTSEEEELLQMEAKDEAIVRNACDYEPELEEFTISSVSELTLKSEDVTEEQAELKTSGTPVPFASCSSTIYTKASDHHLEKNCHDMEGNKSPNKSAEQNGTCSFSCESDPVKILEELEPSVSYETADGPQMCTLCTVACVVRGKRYVGSSPGMALAKAKAARLALEDLYGFEFPHVLAGIEDLAADLICEKFKELSKEKSTLKCNVYAAVIMTNETNPGILDMKVITFTSGTKGILYEHLDNSGERIIDCHAEVLAVRGSRVFMLTQVETVHSNHSAECIERDSRDSMCRLKPRVQFHLFVSRTPCGDSREHPTNGNDGHLHLKIQNFAGTQPVETERPDNVRCTKSCSDKLMEYNVVGVQGAALSKLMVPVYLSSVVVGEYFDKEHLARALFGRISDIGNLPEGFHLNQPYISSFSFSKIQTVKKTPKHGFCWVEGWSEIEEIDQRTGKLTNNCVSKLLTSNCASKLSKREMFERFTKLYVFTYADLKASSVPHKKSKNKMYEWLEHKGHGAQMLCSNELDNFSRNSVRVLSNHSCVT